MTAKVVVLGEAGTVREHLACISAEDPRGLVTFMLRDDDTTNVSWSGEVRDITKLLGALERVKYTLLRAAEIN